jgi:hypothetical protein
MHPAPTGPGGVDQVGAAECIQYLAGMVHGVAGERGSGIKVEVGAGVQAQ